MKKPVKRYVRWATLVAIAIFAMYVYANQFYRADASVYQIVNSSSAEVVQDKDQWMITPENVKDDLGWLIYPGGKVEEAAYLKWAVELAETTSQRVIIVSFPFKLGILRSSVGSKWMDEYSQVNEWVIIGHSLGGVAAATLANKDDRVAGVVFLASYPNSPMKEDVKMLSIRGSSDEVLNLSQYQKKKENFAPDTEFYVIQGGNHSQFGSYGFQDGDGFATISEKEQHRYMIDLFLLWSQDKFGFGQ